MTDTTVTPMTDADVETPPATTEFTPAEPLKDQGVDFEPAASPAEVGQSAKPAAEGGRVSGLTSQATDKARQLAEDGKARAGAALDQLAQMLTDAAGQVDDKLGGQYGQYARTAASTVQNLSSSVKDKQVDELVEDVRGLVRQSPAIAVGAAAAVGFVLARLIQSGSDERSA